jgi:hypothetical protein
MGHQKPSDETLSTSNEVTELKDKGNEAFRSDNLDQALAFYTKGTWVIRIIQYCRYWLFFWLYLNYTYDILS